MSLQQRETAEKSAPDSAPNTFDTALIIKIRNIILEWGRSNFQDYPWRKVKKQWHGLLAELLLQRTRAGNVKAVFEKFVEKYPEPSYLATASKKEIEDLVYSLGLKWRVPIILAFGQALNEIGGTPPTSLEELNKLPGVGSYAAAAYLSLHKNKRAVIIDANVVRWICRLLNLECNNETRRKKWFINLADHLTPKRNARDFNYGVLDFTMQICTKIPKCSICPIGPKLCLTGQEILNKNR